MDDFDVFSSYNFALKAEVTRYQLRHESPLFRFSPNGEVYVLTAYVEGQFKSGFRCGRIHGKVSSLEEGIQQINALLIAARLTA